MPDEPKFILPGFCFARAIKSVRLRMPDLARKLSSTRPPSGSGSSWTSWMGDDGSATADDGDYDPAIGVLTWAPGDTAP